MGANQSYETGIGDVTSALHTADRKERSLDDGSLQKRRKKAKPASPHRPTVTSVTHNAIALTWLPPRHALHAIIAYTVEVRRPQHVKLWSTLTKNCQGTHYEARHLDSDTEYVFRVRAENIFGTGKPSAPSSPVTTKIFESSSDLNCFISQSHSYSSISPISPFIERRPSSSGSSNFPKSVSYDTGLLEASDVLNTSIDSGMGPKSPSLPADSHHNTSFGGLSCSNVSINQNQPQYGGNFRRRHSFNVHLDGRISTMLNNNSDRFYSTNSLNSSTSTIVTNVNKPNHHNHHHHHHHHNSAGGSATNIYHHSSSNETDSAKTRISSSSSTSSILRNNIHRTSLQPYRKSSIPILLPGTGSNCLNKLRESRVNLKSSNNDIPGGGGGGISPTGNTSLLSTSNNHIIINNNNALVSTPRHRGSSNVNSNSNNAARRNRECRHSLGSTASDSNTTSSSASSSSTKEDYNYNGGKPGEGSRLSLQSVFSDVTMSNHSQTSSDDSSPSRPISFSDLGDLTAELGSFLNGSSFIDSLKTSTTSSIEEETRTSLLDNEQLLPVAVSNNHGGDFYDNNNRNDNNENEDDNDNDIYKLKNDLKNMEITEEKLKFHDLKERMKIGGCGDGLVASEESCLVNGHVSQKEYYQTLDNPWERETESVNQVSENIMAAPFSDDIKIALNAKNNNYTSDDVSSANGGFPHVYYQHYRTPNQMNWINAAEGEGQESRDDFRTLRSVLQSNNMIVKQSRSLPEVVGVVFGEGGETRTLTRGTLTTIEDEEEEEEEAVRITTL